MLIPVAQVEIYLDNYAVAFKTILSHGIYQNMYFMIIWFNILKRRSLELCKYSVGPDVILCDFFAKIDFLLNSIATVVLSTKSMGFKFSKP